MNSVGAKNQLLLQKQKAWPYAAFYRGACSRATQEKIMDRPCWVCLCSGHCQSVRNLK